MAGKSPRLRARMMAEVFYKEELAKIDTIVVEKDKEIDELKNSLQEKTKEAEKYKKEYHIKIEEQERIATANKKLKTDFDQIKESYTSQINELKTKIKELESAGTTSKRKKE
jgi:DNA repair exonuclease SbcCD ATPase subunit